LVVIYFTPFINGELVFPERQQVNSFYETGTCLLLGPEIEPTIVTALFELDKDIPERRILPRKLYLEKRNK